MPLLRRGSPPLGNFGCQLACSQRLARAAAGLAALTLCAQWQAGESFRLPAAVEKNNNTNGKALLNANLDCHQLYGLPSLSSTPANIYVGIHSSARKSYWPRRYRSRRLYTACLRAAGIEARFFVGAPWAQDHTITPNSHLQGGLDTKAEQSDANALLEEYRTHGDLEILASRDAYSELTTKLLSVMQTFCQRSRAPYLFKQDDEYGMHYEQVQAQITEHERSHLGQELYAGSYCFSGTEYGSMVGANDTKAPFMSGHDILISRHLACLISEADYAHSALKSFYGTSSDDANLGKWVQYAIQTHGVQVNMVTAPMSFDLDEVEKLPPAS